VCTGDWITLDVAARKIHLEVDDAALEERRKQWKPLPLPERGWARLYVERVLQANQGADFDFLVGSSGSGVPRDSH